MSKMHRFRKLTNKRSYVPPQNVEAVIVQVLKEVTEASDTNWQQQPLQDAYTKYKVIIGTSDGSKDTVCSKT